MKNMDKSVATMEEARISLVNAMKEGNADAQAEAFGEFTNALQQDIITRAKADREVADHAGMDEKLLVNRGTAKAFTHAEMKFFNAVVERGGFEGVEERLPSTLIEDIVGNIRKEHPLLSLIDVRSTNALMTYVTARPDATNAYWGPLCEDIRQMFLSGFKVVDLKASRLSGFVAICKAMIELGPRWIGTYIYESVYEILERELELAVVDGDGANKPIGMTRSIENGTVSDGVTTYAPKATVELTEFTPLSLAGIRARLAEEGTDNGEVVMIVNPLTYYSKVFPAQAYQTQAGSWVISNLPTGERVITSRAVPVDKAIVGVPKNYFLGVAGDLRINEYDQTLAIEDMQLYIAKMYAMGTPKHKDAFIVLDLSEFEGAVVPAADEAEVVTP